MNAEPAGGPGKRPAQPMTAETRQVKVRTWVALIIITTGVAVAAVVDSDASPLITGLLASIAVLELMVAGFWWRSTGGGRRH